MFNHRQIKWKSMFSTLFFSLLQVLDLFYLDFPTFGFQLSENCTDYILINCRKTAQIYILISCQKTVQTRFLSTVRKLHRSIFLSAVRKLIRSIFLSAVRKLIRSIFLSTVRKLHKLYSYQLANLDRWYFKGVSG